MVNMARRLPPRRKDKSDLHLISPNLYLGSQVAAEDYDLLKNLNISNILLVADNATPAFPDKEFSYKVIKVSDSPASDLLSHFDDCIEFIDSSVKSDKAVLVHCVAGISRSSTAVIAYLMKVNRMSFKEALNFVRETRHIADPNLGFVRQLELFEAMNYDIKKNQLRYELYQIELELKKKFSDGVCVITGNFWNWASSLDPQTLYEEVQKSEQLRERITAGIRDSKCDLYCCKGCERPLFSDLNVRIHKKESDSKHSCEVDKMFIEILGWMNDMAASDGPINCPKCQMQVGVYCWKGTNCSICGTLFEPTFCITQFITKPMITNVQ